PSASALKPKKRRLAPGRPSGVWAGSSSASIPASASHPMTEVAYPVATVAAVRAQPRVSAVTMTASARILNASAKVSSISTPLRTSGLMPPSRGQGVHSGGMRQVLELHRIVGILDRVEVAEPLPDLRFDSRVEGRLDVERPALRVPADLPVLPAHLARLDDVPRGGEGGLAVRVDVVNRDVGIGSRPQMPLVPEAEEAGRRRPRDDDDLGEAVLPVQVGQARLRDRLGVD